MLFGFAAAIICATVLTALPGWAGTPEIRGAPARGRWWRSGSPAARRSGRAARCRRGRSSRPTARFMSRCWRCSPAAARARRQPLLPAAAGRARRDARGRRPVLDGPRRRPVSRRRSTPSCCCSRSKGGVFAPVFTGNHLRATGRGDQTPFLMSARVRRGRRDVRAGRRRSRRRAAVVARAGRAARIRRSTPSGSPRWRGWKVLRRAAAVDDARRLRVDGGRVPPARPGRSGRRRRGARPGCTRSPSARWARRCWA